MCTQKKLFMIDNCNDMVSICLQWIVTEVQENIVSFSGAVSVSCEGVLVQ